MNKEDAIRRQADLMRSLVSSPAYKEILGPFLESMKEGVLSDAFEATETKEEYRLQGEYRAYATILKRIQLIMDMGDKQRAKEIQKANRNKKLSEGLT